MAGGKIFLLGIVVPSNTVTGLQSLQQGVAVSTYVTSSYPVVHAAVNHASVKLASGLTFVAVNPLLPPALGITAGVITSYQELLDAGYRIVHIPWETLKGTKNTVTGLNKCVIGSLLSLKEYLDPDAQHGKGIAPSREEQEVLTFEIDDFSDKEEEEEASLTTPEEGFVMIPLIEVSTTGDTVSEI